MVSLAKRKTEYIMIDIMVSFVIEDKKRIKNRITSGVGAPCGWIKKAVQNNPSYSDPMPMA